MSLHGISKDAWMRYAQEGSWYYEIVAPGYKYNMTDIAAAMGLSQLSKLDVMAERRTKIARRYSEAFATLSQVEIPLPRPHVVHSWHLYMLRLMSNHLTVDRGRFIEELHGRNIGTSVHFIPLHLHPYYQRIYGLSPQDYPVAYQEYLREVSLPIYSAMSDEDVDDVIEAVTDVAHLFGT